MDEAVTGGGLPPEFERLWGRPDRPRRGPKPGLSLDAILEAGIELAEREGLAAVSMSRLAGQLGFTTMSLYRYVTNKDELLILMLNAAASVEPPTRQPDEGWRPALERWGRANFEALTGHPWMLDVVTKASPLTPSQLRWVDRGIGALHDTGLSALDQSAVIRLITVYVLGEARLQVDLERQARHAAEADQQVWMLPLMPGFLPADEYPALVENIAAGGFGGPDGYDEADFDFGLARVLDGIESLIASRAKTAST